MTKECKEIEDSLDKNPDIMYSRSNKAKRKKGVIAGILSMFINSESDSDSTDDELSVINRSTVSIKDTYLDSGKTTPAPTTSENKKESLYDSFNRKTFDAYNSSVSCSRGVLRAATSVLFCSSLLIIVSKSR